LVSYVLNRLPEIARRSVHACAIRRAVHCVLQWYDRKYVDGLITSAWSEGRISILLSGFAPVSLAVSSRVLFSPLTSYFCGRDDSVVIGFSESGHTWANLSD
jgi:hypothetical protein